MWEEVFRRFGKENSAMNATDFYAADRFSLFIDLRSMKKQQSSLLRIDIGEYERRNSAHK